MKNLLEFYEESIRLDPEIPDHDKIVGDYINKVKKFESMEVLKCIYSRTTLDIQNYCGSRIDYFASINGNKVIMSKDYIGILDLWFPTELSLFDLSCPIMAGWLVSDIIESGGLMMIDEVAQSPSLLNQSLANLIKVLIGSTIWGFWLVDQRRGTRKRGNKDKGIRGQGG